MNQIFLGPLLSNNRKQLIERCSDLVAKDQSHRFLYLAASQPLLDVVTQEILDLTTNCGVWGELPVYLFRGFVRRILSTAVDRDGQGLTPRIPIDREELPLKRSLISQILARLKDDGKLRAIGPLAAREGCVSSIAALMGEIQRAAKSPIEVAAIIQSRLADLNDQSSTTVSQIDFDKEVALIYALYSELLDKYCLTENDADQLRTLEILRGEISGKQVNLPWLGDVDLLIIDGFFDFTPIQGEVIRELIPRIPETLVHLNFDERNPEIFTPFRETVGQLSAIAPFEPEITRDQFKRAGVLSMLPERLFNPLASYNESESEETQPSQVEQSEIRYFECGDRDTEIRTIAKEVKHLVLFENYHLGDIALVVRQRDEYATTIARVMREESVPCRLELRIDAIDVPAVRAALKLFELLEQPTESVRTPVRAAKLADLIKSEYFRLSDDDLQELSTQFDSSNLSLLSDDNQPVAPEAAQRLKSRYRIGFWDADSLENAIAYVGSDLPVAAWLTRAKKLIKELPTASATKELLSIDSGVQDRDADIADQVENAETAKLGEEKVEKKRRPSRDIHPAVLAWTALVIGRFSELLFAVPNEGNPAELRLSLMRLLDQLGYREQIVRPTYKTADDRELPQVMLNLSALESLRRAFVAAVKSIEFVKTPVDVQNEIPSDSHTYRSTLSSFVSEVRRALSSQSQVLGAANRNGLRVLEATDVRGLEFKALFIAGLVEGGFPLSVSRDWIYPHEERERLKRYGLTLEDISPATLLKEEHYFYQAACRATERLYLTRPLVLEDDSETVGSYYIDELRRAIAPGHLQPEMIRRDYDGKDLLNSSNTRELSVAIVRQEERHRHSGERQSLLPQPRVKRLLTVARNDGILSHAALRRIEIERERAANQFGPYSGQITDPELRSLLERKFGADYIHSASGLGVFGNCPYRFFAERVLKLQPRGEAALDLQAIDAGKLLHDILRRFFEGHRREALYRLDQKALRDELLEIADKVFDEHERVVPPLNQQIWKIDREIRKILLEQVLLYELAVQRDASEKNVLPAFFEIAFGGTRATYKDPMSTDTPLELTRSEKLVGETMKISGQIDRVDLANDNTFVAYDYKLSVGATKEDIRSARSLQIPIYLEALERLILPESVDAGGGYYIIRGGNDRRNRGLYPKEKQEYYNVKTTTMAVMGEDEWKALRAEVIKKIWGFLDQMREGRFVVQPAERRKTCRFCDFAAVCRYDGR